MVSRERIFRRNFSFVRPIVSFFIYRHLEDTEASQMSTSESVSSKRCLSMKSLKLLSARSHCHLFLYACISSIFKKKKTGKYSNGLEAYSHMEQEFNAVFRLCCDKDLCQGIEAPTSVLHSRLTN